MKLVFEGGPLDGQEREGDDGFCDLFGDFDSPFRWWEPRMVDGPDCRFGIDDRFPYEQHHVTEDGAFVMRPVVEQATMLAQALYLTDRIDVVEFEELIGAILRPHFAEVYAL